MGLIEREAPSQAGETAEAPVVARTATQPIGFTPGSGQPLTPIAFSPQADAPSCPDCGSIMVRNGACYKCLNCGATSGCS